MRDRIRHICRCSITVALAMTCASVSGLANADKVTLAKQGQFDFNYCMAGEFTYHVIDDKNGISGFHLDAAMHSNIPNGPFDLQGSHCVGHGATIGGKWSDSGFCKQVDTDGDTWMWQFQTGPDSSGTWEAVAGTGKYSGMTATGRFVPLGFPPAVIDGHFNRCARHTGTYSLM